MSNFIDTLDVYVHVPEGARSLVASQSVAEWTAKAERNGNPILPDEVYSVLLEECDKRPGPAQHHTFGELLNAVAWRTRHLGMGLSRKTGGQRVDSPVGEIAEDIICHTSGHHWDVLGGAAVGQPLRPGRGPSIGIIDLRARPWVAPVQMSLPDPGPGPVDPPRPPAPVPPAPTPPPAQVDLSAVLSKLDALDARLDGLEVELSGKVTSAEFHSVMGNEVVPHIDDLKRIFLGLPRDERFQ